MRRKRSKYNVDVTKKGKQNRTYKGVTYDSITEMQFYKEYIEPRISTGDIKKCERQVTYVLQDGFTYRGSKILPIKYKSDFDVTYRDGSLIVYDVKGNPDSVSLIKRKMFWKRYPEKNLQFVCRCLKYGGWMTWEELKSKRKSNN